MSACAEALEELMALGVSGPALVAAIRRIEQAAYGDRIASLETAVEVATTKADEELHARRERDRNRKRLARVRGIPRTSADKLGKEGPQTPKKNTPFPPLKGGTSPKLSASPEKPKLKPISAWVAEIWEITPKPGRERSGRPALERSLETAERRGADLAAVKAGIEGYYASRDATKNHGEFAQGVHVVIRSGRWEAFAAEEATGPPVEEDPWPGRLTRWRTAAYWNSEWGPKPGKPGYRGPSLEELAA